MKDESSNVNRDAESSPIWPLQFCLAPDDSQLQVRALIAHNWNIPGQSVDSRTLFLWPIRDSLGDVTHCCVAIGGTPWRGIAIVPIFADERAVRTGQIAKVFTKRQTRTLREFVLRALRRENSQ